MPQRFLVHFSHIMQVVNPQKTPLMGVDSDGVADYFVLKECGISAYFASMERIMAFKTAPEPGEIEGKCSNTIRC